MIIDEHLQEQASLHALGVLEGDERRAFEAQLTDRPDLQQLVDELRQATQALALALPAVPPPQAVRDRLFASLEAEKSPILSGQRGLRVLPTPPEAPPDLTPFHPHGPVATPPNPAKPWLPWAVAAALAITAGWSWIQRRQADAALAASRQEAAIYQASLRQAADEKTSLAIAIQRSESDMKTLTSSQKTLQAERDALAATLRTATGETDTLRSQIAQLKQQNDLSNARVAVLGSLIKKNPEARAASLWSAEAQSGVLVVENLPALPPGRDYQLWVLDPTKGAPISAGVFQVDAKGAARVAFKPVEGVSQPDQFAVTEEKKGGVPTPTMTKLVLAGK